MLLQYWSACINKAQEPNPMSSRDGRLLRPVPKPWKLPQAALMQRLLDAMHKIHSLQAGLLCTAWGSSGRPDKASLALLRGLAYAQAGKFEQALRVRRMSRAAEMLVSSVFDKPPCLSTSFENSTNSDQSHRKLNSVDTRCVCNIVCFLSKS